MSKPANILLLSLGNPSEYNGTRHSVGHYILNSLARRFQANNSRLGKFDIRSIVVEDSTIWMYNVPGYMNLSGKSVLPFYKLFMSKFESPLKTPVIILHDELDVPLGKVKIRKQGSSHKGHNGLRNYQAVIGKQYTGLQLGIGRNYEGTDVAKYVLSKFTPDEREILDDVVVDRVMEILKECANGKHVYEKLQR